MKRRVVVTGMGIVSANGINIDDFWRNCLDGQAIVESIPEQWLQYSDFNSKIWAPLPEFDLSRNGINSVEQYQLDQVSLIGLDATFQALENAKITYQLIDERRNTYILDGVDEERSGVFIGTGVGGINTGFTSHSFQVLSKRKNELKNLLSRVKDSTGLNSGDLEILKEIEAKMNIPRRPNPFTVSMMMPNALSANISIKFNLTGPSNTLCSACASGTVAIGHGFYAIQNNLVDMAVVGGSEYLYEDFGSVFRGFDIIKALVNGDRDSSELNRPFDQERSGFLFSQGGAGILVIEEMEHAIKRQAPILAEIISFAETSDAHNIMIPAENGEKIRRMYHKLLQNTNLIPEQIDYINTHGTGTVQNDMVEAELIEEIFGKKPLLNSTKSLIGHSIGASGAIETIVTVLSLKNKTTHICKNLDNPIRDLNFVYKVSDYPIRTAINQSFAFGGHNASLLLKEWEG